MRRIASLMILLALIALGITGCTPLPLVQESGEQVASLPTPAPFSSGNDLIGDSIDSRTERINLMYLSADMQLAPVPYTLIIRGEDNIAELAMAQLLEQPSGSDLQRIAPAGTRLLWFEQSGGIVTINLSGEALALTDQQRVFLRTAITQTLTQLPGGNVEYVSILLAGQSETVLDVPFGLIARSDMNLTSAWLQAQAAQQRFSVDSTSRQLDTLAALYFASPDGTRLLPEARAIRFTSGDLVMPLLRELVRGPMLRTEAVGIMPMDQEPLMSAPTITTSADGRRLITLPFTTGFDTEVKRRGMSMRQLCGSLTLTLLRFVPEVDGVVIRIGQEKIDRISDAQGEQLFADGVMMQADFASLLGDSGDIYLANETGRLVKCKRVLDSYSVGQPRALLEQLLIGPLTSESNLAHVVPVGITSADILGIRVTGGTAIVNLSSNFYRCCQSLNETEEQLLIYAMVNTLCDMQHIDRVQFLVEGDSVDNLAHDLYLRGALIRNPGLVQQPDAT
ncbi:GerMN domain-containing protein [Eubacteriales bacterium OttesenSCG-928-N13]|nr:GerMN domain-containing protein [Eubacteriales bacterium OttesenSCG-928-N13]